MSSPNDDLLTAQLSKLGALRAALAQAVVGQQAVVEQLLIGRLGVLYSNKDYGCEWDYDWRNKRFLAEDNTKFAVNIVMYALTN